MIACRAEIGFQKLQYLLLPYSDDAGKTVLRQLSIPNSSANGLWMNA